MAGSRHAGRLRIGPEHGQLVLLRQLGSLVTRRQHIEHGRGLDRRVRQPQHVAGLVGNHALDVDSRPHGGGLKIPPGIEDHVRVGDLAGAVTFITVPNGGEVGGGQADGQCARGELVIRVGEGHGVFQVKGIRSAVGHGVAVHEGDFGPGYGGPGVETGLDGVKVAVVVDEGGSVLMNVVGQREGAAVPVLEVAPAHDRIQAAVAVAVEEGCRFAIAAIIGVQNAVTVGVPE